MRLTGPFAVLVRSIDRHLRMRQGIFEFTDDPRNMLRASVIEFRDTLTLSDGVVLRPGDRVCDLHLYNERLPRITAAGPTVSWANEGQRRLRQSLQMLAEALQADPRFQGVVAIHVITSFVVHGGARQLERFAHRLHFEMHDPRTPPSIGRRLHDLGENILVWGLIRTFNARGLGTFRRERHRFVVSRSAFLSRYATASNPS